MKSLLTLAGGGAIVTIWRAIPAAVKVPVIFGAGMLAAAEVNMDVNHSWFSRDIYGGEAAKARAQIDDPAATRRAISAGKPVTGAAAAVAAQVKALDADATQKAVTADAAAESEGEILAKKRAGRRVTSTEELRLAELRSKRAEMARQEAEAQIAAARAGYARGYWRAIPEIEKEENNDSMLAVEAFGNWLVGPRRRR